MDTSSLSQSLIFENYSGNEAASIDRFQRVWRRTLQFALPVSFGERLYDLLLCCREGLLNALVHGCGAGADKIASISVSTDDSKTIVRVVIEDPGHGHDFNVEKRIERLSLMEGRELGLAIVHRLSDRIELQNRGSTLVFEFDLKKS